MDRLSCRTQPRPVYIHTSPRYYNERDESRVLLYGSSFRAKLEGLDCNYCDGLISIVGSEQGFRNTNGRMEGIGRREA